MAKTPTYRGHLAAYVISGVLFVVVATSAILATRGYTVDLNHGSVKKTGLLVLGSFPDKAFITINDQVKDVHTRSRLSLNPGPYSVTVDLPTTHPWHKQIDIKPGEAVIEEDILLFTDHPNRIALTDAPVAGYALDASARKLAYLQASPDGVKVLVRDMDGKNQPKQVALLPANYGTPSSFSWSNDGNRLVASVAGESRIITIDGGTTATVSVGGKTALSPDQSDVLVAESEPGTLVRVQTSGAIEPLETDVVAWTVTNQAMYISRSDGSVIRRTSSDRKVAGTGSVQVELVAAPDADRTFGRTADGTVTAFSSSPQEVTTNADRIVPGRGGQQLVYVRQRELRLWNGQDKTDDLLTRFTDVPAQLGVLPGGHYALFGSVTTINSIAADGSNTTELTATDTLLDVPNHETLLVRNATGRLVGLEILPN
ncbi:hypothetical protein EXS54_01110 [Patescibacteria group bacterium]|nr:hypothetical protein [Patescibacteria group bacterium]